MGLVVKKGSNKRDRSSEGIPGPLSAMRAIALLSFGTQYFLPDTEYFPVVEAQCLRPKQAASKHKVL